MTKRGLKRAIFFLTLTACLLCAAQAASAAGKGKSKSAAKKARGTVVSANEVTDTILDQLNLKGFDKLMIVAHPDDESLWGGAHLKKDKYLVVCLSYGIDPWRSAEFAKALALTGDRGIILSHLQNAAKGLNRTQKWQSCREAIRRDVKVLLSYKKWKQVVTHNPDGEYGHIAHKVTNSVVSDVAAKKGLTGKLYYFGKYYSKTDLPRAQARLKKLDAKGLAVKKKLQKIYKKRVAFRATFAHMIPYENWVKASNWR